MLKQHAVHNADEWQTYSNCFIPAWRVVVIEYGGLVFWNQPLTWPGANTVLQTDKNNDTACNKPVVLFQTGSQGYEVYSKQICFIHHHWYHLIAGIQWRSKEADGEAAIRSGQFHVSKIGISQILRATNLQSALHANNPSYASAQYHSSEICHKKI